VFEKLEGVHLLFKKTSREVKVIRPFIIYIDFIISFFSSYFSQFICV